MSELGPIPPGLQALYADERTAPVGGAEARERIRTRVLASVGVGVGVGAASSPATAGSATTAATTGAVSITGKLVVLAIALGALGGGWYWRASSSAIADGRGIVTSPGDAPVLDLAVAPAGPAVSVAVVMPSAPLSATVTLPPALAAPPPPAAITPSRASPTAPAVVTPPVSSSPPAAAQPEVASPAPEVTPPQADSGSDAPKPDRAAYRLQAILLVRAWGAIRRGDAQTALELVERDRGEHPESDFAEEREAVRIVALRRLHHDARARVAAEAFVARYPDSIHRPLVESALEEVP